ncbi:MAG: hypothetical protein WBM07_07440, partial [Chitinivibrionales bacterium]
CGDISYATIDDLITFNPNNSTFWRGWNCIMKHDVGGDSCDNGIRDSAQVAACKKPNYNAFLAIMDTIKTRENDLWVGTFSEVAKYGEERDTHILSVKKVMPSYITFSLSDSMVDSIFNYPLTVKITISSSWVKPIFAIQGQDTLWDSVIIHNENPYLLVNAIPNQGDVTLSPSALSIKTSPIINHAPLKFNLFNNNKKVDIHLSIEESQRIKFSLFSENGKLIKVLVDNIFGVGQFTVSQPLDLTNGLYYLKIDLKNNLACYKPILYIN